MTCASRSNVGIEKLGGRNAIAADDFEHQRENGLRRGPHRGHANGERHQHRHCYRNDAGRPVHRMLQEHRPRGWNEQRWNERRHKEREGVEPRKNLQSRGYSIQQVERQSRCRAIDDGTASLFRDEQSRLVSG